MKDLTLKRIGSARSALDMCKKSTWSYYYWSNVLSYMTRMGEREDFDALTNCLKYDSISNN